MRRTLLAAALVALVGAPGSVQAQDAEPPRGWIGISFEVRTVGNQLRVRSLAVITDVVSASPAERAGITPGDVLLSINHVAGPDSLRQLSDYLRLDPGDPVTMVVDRRGKLHRVSLRAADRANQLVRAPRYTLTFRPDSMVETMFRAMDSLRVKLVQARSGQVGIVVGPGSARSDVSVIDPKTGTVVVQGATPEGAAEWRVPTAPRPAEAWSVFELEAPFEFGLFRSERHDSLLTELDELNRTIRDFRDREGELVRRLSPPDGTLRRVERSDSELVRVRGVLEDLSLRSIRLRKAMQDAARTSAGEAYVTAVADADERVAVPSSPEPTRVFRPLTPYLLGQNRVAGAEVIDLRPGLADYFDVDGGVLVTEVPRGTPAAVAGIRPGDVITHIDQVVVRSVEDLRLGLSRASVETPITLVRDGTSRQVLLRR